jgi:redox-sensitive bicupin YhaK (pirin superfamily)
MEQAFLQAAAVVPRRRPVTDEGPGRPRTGILVRPERLHVVVDENVTSTEPTTADVTGDDGLVLETVPLTGSPWPTVDPFLFCVHHHDEYPAGDGSFAPDAPLDGRELGADFAGIDGWRMYHGRTVPGFPQHPHRGFETVTYMRRGVIDHSDSLGAAARFGAGDAQWLTAGRGIVHSEMFPLLHDDEPNPLELFQIWLNLPAESKVADPHFSMLWSDDVPVVVTRDAEGRAATVTVVAGAFAGQVPPAPPPDSWASRPDADVAIWHVALEPGATVTLPAASGGDTSVRVLYLYEGDARVGAVPVNAPTGVVARAGRVAAITAGPHGAQVLVLQGRPIAEPVASYGPFVMNDEREIRQAFADYQRTGFGGWPWPSDDPVHGAKDRGRFARHADGHEDAPAAAPVG